MKDTKVLICCMLFAQPSHELTSNISFLGWGNVPILLHIQEKFLSCTGIKPKTTSDNLFKTTGLSSSSDDSESEQDKIFDGDEEPCVTYEINNNSSESED